MKRLFIESKGFQNKVESLNDKGLLSEIQNTILRNPLIGVLVRNTGGIRKLRLGLKGKGKSGGVRVFYLDFADREKCYLLFLIEKSESENISDTEREELKKLATILKKGA